MHNLSRPHVSGGPWVINYNVVLIKLVSVSQSVSGAQSAVGMVTAAAKTLSGTTVKPLI